jgi:hypothetical protein
LRNTLPHKVTLFSYVEIIATKIIRSSSQLNTEGAIYNRKFRVIGNNDEQCGPDKKHGTQVLENGKQIPVSYEKTAGYHYIVNSRTNLKVDILQWSIKL